MLMIEYIIFAYNIIMPLMQGLDRLGRYIKWGRHGKKYYYSSNSTKAIAKYKAMQQARAIFANR